MKYKKIVCSIIATIILIQISGTVLAETNNIIENNNSENITNTNIDNSENSVNNNVDNNVNNSTLDSNVVDTNNTQEENYSNSAIENNSVEENSINITEEQQIENVNKAEVSARIETRAEKTKENGFYKIASTKDSSKTMEVKGSSVNNNAIIDIWNYGSVPAQKFYFEYQEEGFYKITAMHTGKALTVKNGNLVEGAEIVQYDYQGLDSQKWILRDTNVNGWVISLLSNPELSLTINGNVENGDELILSNTEDSINQVFLLYDITENEKTRDEGIYKIATGENPSKAIEVKGSNTGNNAQIDIWNYGNVAAQKFYLDYENGYYIIRAMHTGKALTVKNGDISEGTEIVQYDYQGLDSQKWVLRDSGKNGWVISLLSNIGLSISIDGDVENGSRLILSRTQDNDNQMFWMYNISQDERTKEDGTYKITAGEEPNKSIEVKGSNTENNAEVDIWDYGNVPAQKFYLEYQEEGFYKITALHTGKSLTAMNNNSKGTIDVVQYDYEGLDSQKWIIRDSGKNGWVLSLLVNPSISMTIEGNVENGSRIIMEDTEDNANQMFYMYDISGENRTKDDGMYEILISADSIKSLEVVGSNTGNNANIGIWNYGNLPAQKFELEYMNGFYKITALHTGKALTVKDGNIAEGTQIVQYDYEGLNSQKWVLRDTNRNGWVISPLYNLNLSITVEGNIENGSRIILSKTQDNNNQTFLMVEAVNMGKTKDDGTYNLAVGADPSKSIEVAGSSTENNAKVDIWSYLNAKAQKFKVEYLANGYYKITAGHTGKSLTMKDGNISVGTEIVQDDYRGDINQLWIIRDSNINGWVISPMLRPDMAITIENSIENGSRLILDALQYNDRQMFYFYTANLGVDIDNNKYPGIGEAVDALVAEHPNWQFEILYTELDFYTAVQGEYEYAGRTANLVQMNTYSGDWIAPNPVVNGGWASASYEAIAYFMDPRNFLNDVDAFQFVDLEDYAASGATLDSIQYQIAGTFLDGYAADVMAACEETNMNPYFVLARLFQEQGYDGSDTINMDGGDGKLYYNPFNYSASVGDEVNTALDYAKQQGWDTMTKGLAGGIRQLKEGYIDANQNTLYLNKFDVNPESPGTFYSHQYMQNLSAAYSEARIFRGAYEDTGTLDNTIKFIIPVYENMPTEPAARPSGGGSTEVSDTGPISVQVKQTDMGLALRTEPSIQGGDQTLVGSRLPTGTQLISIERLSTGWHKVITLDGRMGYCSADYLDIINDINIANETVSIFAHGEGINVRSEPGTEYSVVAKLPDGTTGIRLIKNIYYANDHWWDLVVFDNGVKGFVATDYLI